MSEEAKKKGDPSSEPMGDVPDLFREQARLMERQWAAAAAKRRGVIVDPAELTAEELHTWSLRAIEDGIEDERQRDQEQALRRQAVLEAACRPMLPEEFEWVDPRAPKLLYDRIANSKATLTQAKKAAESLATGEVVRVLLVGPAGSGKTSLAALIPQVMAARWAQDRYEREVAGIDQRPVSEIAVERLAARRSAERDLSRPAAAPPPRRRPAPSEQPQITPLGKTLARVTVEGGVSALWTTAHKLFKLAKKLQGFREAEPLAEACEARLLVLDDIGGEPTQANIAPVEDVLRERHDAQRITIATTGMFDEKANPADLDALLAPLSSRYGAAVVRRLAEKGRAVVIPVGIKAAARAA